MRGKGRFVMILLILSIVFCLCSHIYCLFIYGMQPFHISRNLKKGVPYIFQSDEDYYAEIRMLRVTDDYVYVLYGGKSIVKVYQHNGEYIGTIAVYDRRASGGTSLYTDHSRAYIDHGDCLYEFEGTEFIHCYTTDNGDRAEKLKEVRTVSIPAKDYSFRYGNVIKYENTPQEYAFIKRSFLHRIAYPGILLPAEVCIFLIWFLIYKLRAR